MSGDGIELPRWFIVVRRDKPTLYRDLRETYEGDARVQVIQDRRRAASRAGARRLWERRMRHRRAAPEGDRRQAERRLPLAPPQEEFWVSEGFFMVRRAPDTPRR